MSNPFGGSRAAVGSGLEGMSMVSSFMSSSTHAPAAQHQEQSQSIEQPHQQAGAASACASTFLSASALHMETSGNGGDGAASDLELAGSGTSQRGGGTDMGDSTQSTRGGGSSSSESLSQSQSGMTMTATAPFAAEPQQCLVMSGLPHVGANLTFDSWLTQWHILAVTDPVQTQVCQ